MKRLKIEGLNITRFLNQLQINNIYPQKIVRLSYNELEIQISNKEYKKLVDIKIASCYNISVIESKPTCPLGVMALKRSGFFVGLLASMVLLISATQCVWNIEISVAGEDNASTEAVALEALKEVGVTMGSKLELSPREIERILVSKCPDCSSVVVKRRGINLEIVIKPRVLEPTLSGSDIVSKYDGKITEINYSSGILTVNIGEGVSKGQVLIASGKVGDYYSEAMGEIRAKVLISGEAIGSIKTEKFIRTGQVVEVNGYQLFGKTYYFDKNLREDNIFANYEVEKREVFLSKNMGLPLKKVTFSVFELVSSEENREAATVVAELKTQAYKVAKASLPMGAVEMGVSYDVFNDNGFYKVVCNIETEIEIGMRTQ